MIDSLNALTTTSLYGSNFGSAAGSSLSDGFNTVENILASKYDVANLVTGENTVSFNTLLAASQEKSLNFTIYNNANNVQSLLQSTYLGGSSQSSGSIYDQLL